MAKTPLTDRIARALGGGRADPHLAELARFEARSAGGDSHETRNVVMELEWFARLVEREALSPEQRRELLAELADDARAAGARRRPRPTTA